MRNKVLRRIVIGMAIAMFVVTVAIVGAFIIVSLNDTETEVHEFSEPIVDQISRLDNISRLSLYIANKKGSSIKITVINSAGEVIEDTNDKTDLKHNDILYDEMAKI